MIYFRRARLQSVYIGIRGMIFIERNHIPRNFWA